MSQAKSSLKHKDIVGQVQQGRVGLGLGTTPPTWQKATPALCWHLVVEEVRLLEEVDMCARAVSQAKQGFTIGATYDVLPSSTNLHLWFGEDPACLHCLAPVTLKHILVGCKTSLMQGRYTWRHNQVPGCYIGE